MITDKSLWVKLPCQVGDKIYHVFPKKGIVECKVKRFQIGSYGLMIVDKFAAFSIAEIGKSVFLTYKEAESAYKNLKEKNKLNEAIIHCYNFAAQDYNGLSEQFLQIAEWLEELVKLRKEKGK